MVNVVLHPALLESIGEAGFGRSVELPGGGDSHREPEDRESTCHQTGQVADRFGA